MIREGERERGEEREGERRSRRRIIDSGVKVK
jgi:hypothetical protein